MTADIIKSAVTVPMALNMYGYGSDRTRIPCPIHNGKDANFSIRDDHWHCFVCGEGGDVITLVMKLFNLPFRAACERLNADFRLGIDLHAPVDTALIRAHRAAQAEKKRVQAERDEQIRRLCDEHRRLWQAKQTKAPRVVLDGLTEAERIEAMGAALENADAEWVEALRRLDYIQYQLDEMERAE
jgi:DNA primase